MIRTNKDKVVKISVIGERAHGRIYRRGSVSIGIITHSNSYIAGHGPGVTTLFTSTKGLIEPVIDDDANIAKIMGLRDDL